MQQAIARCAPRMSSSPTSAGKAAYRRWSRSARRPAYDVQVIPHGHSTHATAQLLYAQPPQLCSLIEYPLKWNQILHMPLQPMAGLVVPPDKPGMGMELGDAKIVQDRELLWERRGKQP